MDPVQSYVTCFSVGGTCLFYGCCSHDETNSSPFPSQSPSHKGKRQQQELITELRRRQGKDSRHVYEGKDGAIEDIITGETEVTPGRRQNRYRTCHPIG